ncbi:hypothetical protein F442_11001 [Phytophthora nicotianae P10297]|uniref:Uncharacterized protein n=4 Tax=Phytophthora nicotianae TaxID=4792 RepID=W2Q3T0_PHYN3|nr:hypothetical protein PPTG_23170 [Phytophthora nicotianae INRA-310]ETI52509.1 hypothetical protein F443_04349 [Phytophthora nicotianae P1569]ETL90782.1 hypothetical protein L917_10612 [Phytophthora nicotianae]ETN07787.1 hypothetical protein PPTG_23170 [Phytophthora nicotianae INRA-310]ETP42062.1 hypothetical protein F442_11001 [Phytophthora nicotianae P10297]
MLSTYNLLVRAIHLSQCFDEGVSFLPLQSLSRVLTLCHSETDQKQSTKKWPQWRWASVLGLQCTRKV